VEIAMLNTLSKKQAQLLVPYWIASGISGAFVGVLMAGLQYGCGEWEKVLAGYGNVWRFPDPVNVLLPFAIVGMVIGVTLAPCWHLAARSAWGAYPAFIPSITASLAGCIWLVVAGVCEYHRAPPKIVLAHLVGTLALGALYGFLLTLLVRPLRRWLVDDASGPAVR
jgi:hypothetical protein